MNVLIVLALLPIALARESAFIVGGQDTTIGANPWQGSLRLLGSHSCGCVVASENWILTAAHCVGSGTGAYTFLFGATSRTGSGQLVSASAISINPGWDNNCPSGNSCFPNDIAVVSLASSLSFGANVDSVPMASSCSNSQCRITGWGRTCGLCGLPDILQTADIDVLTDAQCIGAVGGNYNAAHHICVQDLATNLRGSCNGDSGGPLTCSGELCGITSWGYVGCSPTNPSVYTRVSTYRSWACGIANNELAGC